MNLETLINKYYDQLNDNDLHVISYVSQNIELCKDKTVTEIAKNCNVSPSTIIRTTKKIGFDGYSEFRYFIKEEADRIRDAKVSHNQSFHSSVLLKDVQETIKLFEGDKNLQEIYKLFLKSKNIFAYGTGYGQNLMLKEFSRCLLNHNIFLNIIPSKTELELISQAITPNDLLIVASLSGKTGSIDAMLKNIVVKKVPTISVTVFSRNELAYLANYNLYYQVTHLNKVNQLNNSSYCTLNLVLSLLYEGFTNYLNERESAVK
ncbi:MurR/RpiR family transcriptional regulator [Neobacillus notoginsengisoli]|uniref:MurR/RpiR family transcriptional regulator n=1 Tax=Neobacillus notoginsengisoli TaxID=1578198 RepID=A0A417YYK4_9BACI|nr:MurR/RpiR family transcriptional regulator [Neobacillus notoginsengisoli]RHW42811.1 MurR/RpiR family transcriptional regulator [Neobacillus notoginsengisoli]